MDFIYICPAYVEQYLDRHQFHSSSSFSRWAIRGASIVSFLFATLHVLNQILWTTSDIHTFFWDYLDLPLVEDMQLPFERENKTINIANWLTFLTVCFYLSSSRSCYDLMPSCSFRYSTRISLSFGERRFSSTTGDG